MQFHFDEMNILGEGLLAYGTATLADVGEGYEGEFYVEEIELVGGQRLKASGNGPLGFPSPFMDTLFKAIASQIENAKCPIGRAAADEWSDHLEGNAPQPAVYSTLNHRTQGISA